jgi:hypothetical protein
MLHFTVRVAVLRGNNLCLDEEMKGSANGIDEAVELTLGAVPHLLSSVMETATDKVDRITLSISFSRPYSAHMLYKLMDKLKAHSLGLFEILEDEDENLEILPERPQE